MPRSYAEEIRAIVGGITDAKREEREYDLRRTALSEQITKRIEAQENVDRAWDYSTGSTTISPELAGALGMDNLAGKKIPREQLGVLTQGASIQAQKSLYQTQEYKERAKIKTEKEEAELFPSHYIDTGELKPSGLSGLDWNINEPAVKQSVLAYTGHLKTKDAQGLVPYDVAITKLKKDPNDAYGLHHITQAEGMLQAALTPGMTERNPWLLGITKKTGSDKWKSETEAQALSLIKAFKKAQGHSSKDIQIHIDNLKKKYTK